MQNHLRPSSLTRNAKKKSLTGQSLTEYGLIISLVSIGSLYGLSGLGSQITQNLNETVGSANAQPNVAVASSNPYADPKLTGGTSPVGMDSSIAPLSSTTPLSTTENKALINPTTNTILGNTGTPTATTGVLGNTTNTTADKTTAPVLNTQPLYGINSKSPSTKTFSETSTTLQQSGTPTSVAPAFGTFSAPLSTTGGKQNTAPQQQMPATQVNGSLATDNMLVFHAASCCEATGKKSQGKTPATKQKPTLPPSAAAAPNHKALSKPFWPSF